MPASNRLLALDGVRSVAALWVVLGHAWGFYYPVHRGVLGLATNWLSYNHFAVDVFIVLSGFCLALPTLSTGALRGTVGQFYRRRATRILPPLYVSLLLGFLLVWFTSRVGSTHEPIRGSVIVTNLLLVQDWFPQLNTVNVVTWSVALELKIYLLFPLILLARRKAGWAATATAAAVLSYGLTIVLRRVAPGVDISWACPWYLFLFTAGCTACEYAHKPAAQRRAWAAWALAAVSLAGVLVVVWIYPITPASRVAQIAAEPWSDGFLGVGVAAVLFLLASGGCRWLRTLFETRWLVYIGVASYSLYLIHLPLLFAARIVVNRLHFIPASSPARLAAVALLGFPLVAVGTYLFFCAVERPFLKRRATDRLPELALEAVIAPAP